MAFFDGVFDIEWEVTEAVDFEGFADATEDEEHLHLDLLTAWTYWPCDVMQKS